MQPVEMDDARNEHQTQQLTMAIDFPNDWDFLEMSKKTTIWLIIGVVIVSLIP